LCGGSICTEQAAAKRTVGDQSDIEFPARREHAVALGFAVQKAVLDLVGGQRDASPTEGVFGSAHLSNVAVAHTHGGGFLSGPDCVGHPVYPWLDADQL